MTKKFLTFGILLIVLTGILLPSSVNAGPDTCPDGTEGVRAPDTGLLLCNNAKGVADGVPGTGNVESSSGLAGWIWKTFAQGIGYILITISSLALLLSGWVFDEVVKFTILDMAKNLGGGAGGVGDAITTAWATLRDIANICFIFVLLFAAFKNMFQYNINNFGTTVRNIIIVALLINFSLFFSKVIIDASNVVAVGFYKSITNTSVTYNTNTTKDSAFQKSISAGYMNMLGLQTFFGDNILTNGKLEDGGQILAVGIITAVFMLITAVILLIAGIMFVARFIILVFLMILSPLALIAYIIPGQSKHFDSWFDSLKNQSFFAPLYFALTWVVFKVGSSLIGVLGKPEVQWSEISTNPKGVLPLIINYVLIIGFSIAALVLSKQMATSGATGGAFKAISGGISTGVVGGTAWLGRTSVGQAGKYFSENAKLQGATKSTNFLARTSARAALYASEKARSATFDARNASIPTSVVGDAIQGTLGRTKYGKKLGLDDVNIPSVAMGTIVKDMDILGKGGDKGYKETKEESAKRVRDREAASASELALAQAKKDIMDGIGAIVGSPAYDTMEKALAKLSDKETEALVASNRELLKSQNFANVISVKQLEALNKSDQFSEEEKKSLKGTRFKIINDAMAIGGGGAISVSKNIKALSDSELEMIEPDHLKSTDFIKEMRPAQAETIIKSNKFTTSQKDGFKNARKAPLLDALDTTRPGYAPSPGVVKDMITKTLGPKDVAGLMSTNATFVDHTGTTVTDSILTHPEVLNVFTPNLLKRMVPEMSAVDIEKLHDVIEDAGTTPGASSNVTKLATWLTTPDGAVFS